MRRLLATLIAGLLALALAGPALAWDSVRVQVAGPGITEPIDGSGGDLIPALLDGPTLTSAPTGDLGSSYAVTYSDRTSGRAYGSQVLYPYAPGGPLTFSSSTTTIADHQFAAGWRRAPASTLELLMALGLPGKPVAADQGPAQVTSARPEGSALGASDGALAFVALAFGLLLVGAVFTVRRLRTVVRPTPEKTAEA